MKRRVLLGSAIAASGALVTGGNSYANTPGTLLVYVGGWDCGPCITWKNKKKADFLASPLAKKLRYVEVESPKLREAYQVSYWPADIRFVRDQLPEKQRFGTPRFLIVQDGKLLASEWGSGEWDRTLTTLQALLKD